MSVRDAGDASVADRRLGGALRRETGALVVVELLIRAGGVSVTAALVAGGEGVLAVNRLMHRMLPSFS